VRAGGLLVAGLAALAIGCGSSDEADREGDSTVAAVSAHDTASGLSRRQYDALEELMVAMVPLDETDGPQDQGKTQRALDDVAAACSEVDRGDPLLAAMVDGCERILGSLAAADPDCSSASRCAAVFRSLADAMGDLARTARKNQPTIDRGVSDAHCRQAMLSTEATEVAELAASVYRRAGDAVENADQDAYADLEDDMAALEERSDALPSQRQQLERFRRYCLP
jgi:hypothetical protein